MKLKTAKMNLIMVAFFVINILAIPSLTTTGMAAEAAAGAAKAGAAGGTAIAAGVTTGTIAAGAAIAATAGGGPEATAYRSASRLYRHRHDGSSWQ